MRNIICGLVHNYAMDYVEAAAARETTMTSGSFDDALSVQTEAILQRFNQVFLTHDPAALRSW